MSKTGVVPFCFESQEVRVITVDDEPWFIAKDVCEVLEVGTEQTRRLDDDEKGLRKVQTLGGAQDLVVISESGLYTLVIRSNKPQAKPFRRWVTHEVLPSVRKTGSYNLPQKKEVKVQHTHLRRSLSENGLDIRYSLDLTKVITNPTPNTLELLERLTGIPLSDLAMAPSQESDLEQSILCYIDLHCIVGEGRRVSIFQLYTAFSRWWEHRFQEVRPTIRQFSSVIYQSFPKVKSSIMYAQGLALKEEANG